MPQLAIKGHPTRGKEVIEILRSLGGINLFNFSGVNEDSFYYIGKSGIICYCSMPHNRMEFTLEEFLEKYPYKVWDKVLYLYSKAHIKSMKWDGIEIMYTVDRNKKLWETSVFYLQPYKEEAMENNLTVQDIKDNNAEWLLNKLREMSADGALQTISDLYDELHKPQYPQTYEKCCEIIGAQPNRHYFYTIRDKHDYPHEVAIMRCLDNLRQLLICRDAYLKIAVEQIGEPWEPNWTISETKFTIVECAGIVVKSIDMCNKRILAFPTEEMRDAFYENFKDLIEACKELL